MKNILLFTLLLIFNSHIQSQDATHEKSDAVAFATGENGLNEDNGDYKVSIDIGYVFGGTYHDDRSDFDTTGDLKGAYLSIGGNLASVIKLSAQAAYLTCLETEYLMTGIKLGLQAPNTWIWQPFVEPGVAAGLLGPSDNTVSLLWTLNTGFTINLERLNITFTKLWTMDPGGSYNDNYIPVEYNSSYDIQDYLSPAIISLGYKL